MVPWQQKYPGLEVIMQPRMLQPDSLPPGHPVFTYSVFIFSFTKEHPNWGSRCPLRTDLTEKVIYIQMTAGLSRLGYLLTLCLVSGSVFPCSSVSLMFLSRAPQLPQDKQEKDRESRECRTRSPWLPVPWHTSVFSPLHSGTIRTA